MGLSISKDRAAMNRDGGGGDVGRPDLAEDEAG